MARMIREPTEYRTAGEWREQDGGRATAKATRTTGRVKYRLFEIGAGGKFARGLDRTMERVAHKPSFLNRPLSAFFGLEVRLN